jgi:hypothetical protein
VVGKGGESGRGEERVVVGVAIEGGGRSGVVVEGERGCGEEKSGCGGGGRGRRTVEGVVRRERVEGRKERLRGWRSREESG